MVSYPLFKQAYRMRFNQLRSFGTIKRFYDPKNDIAFRKIFGEKHNKPILLSFLNAVLRREGNNLIEEVELLPPELAPRFEHTKKSILDVFCSDKAGHKYIVEMQNKRLISFIQRLEYYATRSYSDSLVKAANYLELKPVILLAIANHKVFPDDVPYISYHCTREGKTSQCFLPNISYAFVEIPKFNKHKEKLKTPEEFWVHFLKEASNETEPPKKAPSEIKEAYEILERYRWSSEENIMYERTMMAILDEDDLIRTAKIDARKEMALKLSELGFSLDIIVDVTGLSSSEITKLINQ
ncbi:35015_t:CDS:1 [Gigaspora margarita]|uniref:35015_t:CDS:1 n=1 Tax=Gigaspora margarita TaxID=4874 RepID=A0ABN7UG13_GIGMA|nr:35015_t:CDS:1 [Gigaspora margarita]